MPPQARPLAPSAGKRTRPSQVTRRPYQSHQLSRGVMIENRADGAWAPPVFGSHSGFGPCLQTRGTPGRIPLGGPGLPLEPLRAAAGPRGRAGPGYHPWIRGAWLGAAWGASALGSRHRSSRARGVGRLPGRGAALIRRLLGTLWPALLCASAGLVLLLTAVPDAPGSSARPGVHAAVAAALASPA